jgi:nucleotide-binding universal stress UspA family protein
VPTKYSLRPRPTNPPAERDGGGSARPLIVVGCDRRAESGGALETAVRLAHELDAEVRAVHVVDLRDYPVDPDRGDWEEKGEERLVAERERISSLLVGRGVAWSYFQARGDPASALIAAAGADSKMIVIGGHGPGLGGFVHRLVSPGSAGV